jgi:beta-lactam-binding protein with PASTA domain
MRGKKRPLITVLTALAFIVYVLIPGIALLALRLDVQRERRMRPTQIQVPAVKGLTYEDAETRLRASNLNIRLLATRSDLPLQPGLVIEQNPQPGEKVDHGYAVGVTVTRTDSKAFVGDRNR